MNARAAARRGRPAGGDGRNRNQILAAAPARIRGQRVPRGNHAVHSRGRPPPWSTPHCWLTTSATKKACSPPPSNSCQRPLTATITDPDLATTISGRRVGFTLAMSHLLGLAFARYLTRLPALADLDFETLIAQTTPAVQLHLSTPDPN